MRVSYCSKTFLEMEERLSIDGLFFMTPYKLGMVVRA